MEPSIHCSFDELVEVDRLQPNPKNPNKHPEDQVDLLGRIMKYQGIRSPVTVSKRSGFIVKGHGRLMAAKNIGLYKYPVDFQDYENEAQEYADMVADNKIAELASTDLSMVNAEIGELGPDFELDMLGMIDFKLDPSEIDPNSEWDGMPEFDQQDKTAHQTIQLHLFDEQAVKDFAELIKQPITSKTRSIWYPAQPTESTADKRYGD